MQAPERIAKVSSYILEHFAQKTRRDSRHYDFSKLVNIGEVATARDRSKIKEIKAKTRMQGFNAIFAVSSIPFVKLYYTELKKQMAQLQPDKRLKIATIFSYAPNVDVDDETPEDTEGLDQNSRDFLEAQVRTHRHS